MFINVKASTENEQLIPHIKKFFQGALEGFELKNESISLEGVDNLYELFDQDTIFLIQDGMLNLTYNDQILCGFDEGHLVGIANAFGFVYPVLRTDEFVELIPINRDEFLRHVYSDKRRQHYWSNFLVCSNAILMNQLAEHSKALGRTTAGFQNIAAGEIIIHQGDQADLVYTIIEGEAEAFVDDVKVGDIHAEEVFGAMAVFTDEPRSATVKAKTACTIMAVPKTDFIKLIEAQPQAAVNLIENLAQNIRCLNQQLIDKQIKTQI